MSYTVLVSNEGGHDGTTRFNLWISEDGGLEQRVEDATSFRFRMAAQDAIYRQRARGIPHKKTKYTIYENYGTPECRNMGSTIYED